MFYFLAAVATRRRPLKCFKTTVSIGLKFFDEMSGHRIAMHREYREIYRPIESR